LVKYKLREGNGARRGAACGEAKKTGIRKVEEVRKCDAMAKKKDAILHHWLREVTSPCER
jgi:hypothetical protein